MWSILPLVLSMVFLAAISGGFCVVAYRQLKAGNRENFIVAGAGAFASMVLTLVLSFGLSIMMSNMADCGL